MTSAPSGHAVSDSRLTIRPVRTEDYDAVRRITRDAYLEAGYFADDAHPYMAVLSDIEHRAQHAEVWVAERDGTVVRITAESVSGAVTFDPDLGARLATDHAEGDWPVIPTQAGHDAGILAARLPTAMLFVRNPTGISHAPQESAAAEDIDAGVDALVQVVRELG